MKNKAVAEEWKQIFSEILKLIFSHYNLKDNEFAKIYKCDESSTKNWKTARCFPSRDLFGDLSNYILEKSKSCEQDDKYLLTGIETIFSKHDYASVYMQLKQTNIKNIELVLDSLKLCIDVGKGNIAMPIKIFDSYEPEGQTRVVVFDFDGTLTRTGKIAKTTWEGLWISLGYDVKECQQLHRRFDLKEITHEEWCSLTEEKFKERNLHRDAVKEISKKIQLIKGVKETFQQLNERDIKIYIVSGSIKLVIQSVLGNLNKYIDGINANQFMFDKEGYLTRIIGTKYDFEGKADCISQIADELKISTKDILFIGNSHNDHYAYESGARTLCINPILTDITNTTIWHECIETCNDLTEIFNYI